MGIGSSRAPAAGGEEQELVRRRGSGGKRRKHRHESIDEVASDEDEPSISPKRQRIQNTATYIYETFFLKGTGSDVTIRALDNEWKLHKNYLRQSHYFESMFSGRWVESDLSLIELDIPDPNITREALDVAFSSLYKDSIHLEQSFVASTVAAATMLQLDGLLEHCSQFMKETIGSLSVVSYLGTATQYGLKDIETECRFWLLAHLLTEYTADMLLDISVEMLIDLISSPDLFVMQVEMDIYSLVKKWLYLHSCSEWSGNQSKLTSVAEEYFQQRESEQAFLDTESGQIYQEICRSIRLKHILVDPVSIGVLENDRIIPADWMLPLYRQQWLTMIAVDQRNDSGPSTLTEEEFNETAIRCGRILQSSDEYCWRWTGFSFGVDILLTYNNGLISVKRNTRSQPCLSAVSLQNSRPLTFRLRVASFGENEEVCSTQDTGIVHLTLAPDEAAYIMTVSKQAQFPLYISFNFALTSHITDPSSV